MNIRRKELEKLSMGATQAGTTARRIALLVTSCPGLAEKIVLARCLHAATHATGQILDRWTEIDPDAAERFRRAVGAMTGSHGVGIDQVIEGVKALELELQLWSAASSGESGPTEVVCAAASSLVTALRVDLMGVSQIDRLQGETTELHVEGLRVPLARALNLSPTVERARLGDLDPETLPHHLHEALTGIELASMELTAYACALYMDCVPFGFIIDMARQAWDEGRHCAALSDRISELGQSVGAFPRRLPTILSETFSDDPALFLVRLQCVGELRGLEALSRIVALFAELGDATTADIALTMLMDEALHVRNGLRWLRYLRPDEASRLELLRRTIDGRAVNTASFPDWVNVLIALEFAECRILSGQDVNGADA